MLPRTMNVLSGSSTVSFYPSDAIIGVVTSCKAAPTCRLCPKPSLGLSQFSGRSLTHCVTLGYLGLILTCCPVLSSDLINMALTSDLGSWVNPSAIFRPTLPPCQDSGTGAYAPEADGPCCCLATGMLSQLLGIMIVNDKEIIQI